MFRVGDKVYCDNHKQAGTITSLNSGSSTYPIQVHFNNRTADTYTKDGRVEANNKPSLRITHPSATTNQYSIISIEQLAQLVTLPDGTRIYHPASGQPFQLTTKETLI